MASSDDGNPFEWDEAYTGDGVRDYEPPDAELLAEVDRLTPGRVLDLGCGAGGLAIAMAERGWAVTGVDISDRAVASARQNAAARALDIEFEVGDVTEYAPVPGFDLITSSFALPPGEGARAELLRRSSRALADGGMLLVAEWEASTVDDSMMSNPQDWTSLAEIKAALGGLEIVRGEVVDHAPHDHSRDSESTDGPIEHSAHVVGHGSLGDHRHAVTCPDGQRWQAFYVVARKPLIGRVD